MKTRKYTLEFKEMVVQQYLSGVGTATICREHQIGATQLRHWVKQWKEFGTFPDGRGKSSVGRPKSIDTGQMSKDEYIRFLEMENDVLKQLRSLNSKKQK